MPGPYSDPVRTARDLALALDGLSFDLPVAFVYNPLVYALGESGPRIGSILHPSPASPLANRGWAARAEAQLCELGIEL